MRCTLCEGINTKLYLQDKVSACNYWHCNACDLIFMNPKDHLNKTTEKIRYDFHDNRIDDPRYLKFLSPMVEDILPFLQKDRLKIGLDFGCGIAQPLNYMMSEKGYRMESYDPFYFPKKPAGSFDFVVATEVIEHFNNPAEGLASIDEFVKPGGYIGCMSWWFGDEVDFTNWHYRKDDTHVSFYSEKTLKRIESLFGWTLVKLGKRTVVYQKVMEESFG